MKNKTLLWLLAGTALAMIPGYLLRFRESVYMYLFSKLTTYPGDLWNFFANYLGKGQRYPPEYPAGLRFFYEIMNFRDYESYTLFFTMNAVILGAFAVATTYLLYLILKTPRIHTAEGKPQKSSFSRLWYFWILAPSFLFYGTVNYDLPVIFLIVLAVYLFSREKYYYSVFWLAVGMVAKVFPVFLLPVFIWKAPSRLRIRLVALFALVVIVLNLPYALSDFHAWIYPYLWQISSNITTGPSQGTYWWLIYPFTGKLTGWISLGLFGFLYFLIYRKLKEAPFFDLCLAVILIFLLTDRIYSPQYNLYLLPFLVIALYGINKKIFYVLEVPNLLVVLFCFFLKNHPLYLQIAVFVRYIALILVLLNFFKLTKNNLPPAAPAPKESSLATLGARA